MIKTVAQYVAVFLIGCGLVWVALWVKDLHEKANPETTPAQVVQLPPVGHTSTNVVDTVITKITVTTAGQINQRFGVDLREIVEFTAESESGNLKFPTHKGNTNEIELGIEVFGGNSMKPIGQPPSISAPAGYRWIKIDDPLKAGRHRNAVLETGRVWAVEPIPVDTPPPTTPTN